MGVEHIFVAVDMSGADGAIWNRCRQSITRPETHRYAVTKSEHERKRGKRQRSADLV